MKRVLQNLTGGVGTTSGAEPPALLHKRVESLKADYTAPKKPPTLKDFFTRVTAKDLAAIDGKKFEVVREDTSLTEAIEITTQNKVTSIPVVDAQGDFASVFSVYDIIDYMLEDAKVARLKDLATTEPYRCTLRFQQEFADCKVKDIKSKPWVAVKQSATLLDCLAHFCSHSTHLLGVLNENGEVVGVLHRIQILKFLYYNKEMAKDIMSHTMQAFNHILEPVSLTGHHTVKAHSLQELFNSMWQKVMDGDMVSYGHTNVDKFINLLIQILMVNHEELPEPDFDSVKETDTVEHVFGLMLKTNTANTKVIILSSACKKPIGMLCFCDILTELYRLACTGCLAPIH